MIERLKKINIKFVVKSFTLIWGLVLIILMTIANVGLTEDFNWIHWLSNSLIIFMITVFGLLMGESSGKDKQLIKPDGLYQKNKAEYEKTKAMVEPELGYFPQYYDIERQDEYFRKKLDHITTQNITREQAELILKYCQKSDIELLKEKPLEFEGNYIRKITDEEVIEVIMDVYEGRVKFEAEPVNYFLTLNGDSENIGTLEVGHYKDRKIKKTKGTNRGIKIATQLVFSLVWGLLTVKDFMDGNDAQAWVNLVSRIVALFTSYYSGYLSAVLTVKLEAEKIENKVVILTLFHNALLRKTFIPKLENELARAEYEKSLQIEQKEPEKAEQNNSDKPIETEPEKPKGEEEHGS